MNVEQTAAYIAHEDRNAAAISLVPYVLSAAAGDKQAFERLVDYTKNAVCSIALAIVRDVEASEEIAQDVYISAWRQMRRLRKPASFLPWLRQLTRNRSYDYIRSQIRARRRIHSIESATSPDPRIRLLKTEELEIVREALEHLPDESRELVTLYYREDCSVRQVAQLLDLSEDAVKQRLARARHKLKDQVEAHFSGVVKNTMPGLAFTAGVSAALAFGAPVSASAAAIGLAAKSSPGLAFGVAAGALGGFLGGAIPVVLGTRKSLQLAMNDRERRGLLISAFAQFVMMGCFFGFIVMWHRWSQTPLKDKPGTVLMAIALYWLGMNAIFVGWNQRVIRPRRELQRIQDPEGWRIETRQEKFGVFVSLAVLVLMLIGFGGALYLRQWLRQ